MKAELEGSSAGATSGNSKQFSTFYVANRLYGIDVMEVQEIAKPLPITPIHLAPDHVLGLINLRGQIATAIGLQELFELKEKISKQKMSVVCKCDGALLSLLVDQIGDVIEVSEDTYEQVPVTVEDSTRRFLKGVYKTSESILSVIEVSKINNFLTK
jgi:purine-binding chemotaxis protein CheW